MTQDSNERRDEQAAAPEVTERQLVGYRIRETRPPEEQQLAASMRRSERRRRLADRAFQLVDYAFVLLYALLGIRLVLGLVAANENAGFVRFISAVTQPFYAPFVDIVQSPTLETGRFELPIVICMLAYLLLHLAIRGLLHVIMGTRRPV